MPSFIEFVEYSSFKTELMRLFTSFNDTNTEISTPKKIKLVELSWNNIYKFSNQHVLNFDSIGIDHIAGLNASGKSSVLYILTYALFGGKYSSLPMTKDLVLHNGNTNHGTINCEFYIEDDKYIISRNILRKSADKITLTLNNKKIECDQDTLTNIFGDRELFLSIFCATQNHEYFVDKTAKTKYSLIETLFGFEYILENIKRFKSIYLQTKKAESLLKPANPDEYTKIIENINTDITIVKNKLDVLKSQTSSNKYKSIKDFLSNFVTPPTLMEIKSTLRIGNIVTDIQKIKEVVPDIHLSESQLIFKFNNLDDLFETYDRIYLEAAAFISDHKEFLQKELYGNRNIKSELLAISININTITKKLFNTTIVLTPGNINELTKRIIAEIDKTNAINDDDCYECDDCKSVKDIHFNETPLITNVIHKGEYLQSLNLLQENILNYVNTCVEFANYTIHNDNLIAINNDIAEYYRSLIFYFNIFEKLRNIYESDITSDQLNQYCDTQNEISEIINTMSNLMYEKKTLEEKIIQNNKMIQESDKVKRDLVIYDEYNEAITKYKDAVISQSYKTLEDRWNAELNNFFVSQQHIRVSVLQSGEILLTDFNTGNFISADVASGFQKFILDITFRITMRELITKIPKYNLLIIDEGFGVADDINSKLILPYLQSKINEFKILVISHSSEFINDSINQIEITKCISNSEINSKVNKKNNIIGGDDCIISQNDLLTFTCKCCNVILTNKSTATKHLATKKHDSNYITYDE